MTFQKGNKLGKGRAKGSVNMLTVEKRNLIEYLKEEGSQTQQRERR